MPDGKKRSAEMEAKTKDGIAEWELIEEESGRTVTITRGTEEGVRWLGSMTVPRSSRSRIVARPVPPGPTPREESR